MKLIKKSILFGFRIFITAVVLSGCNIFPYVQNETAATISNDVLESPQEPTQPVFALQTEIQATATSTATPELIEQLDVFFTIQEGTPFYMPAFSHPDAGCEWFGVAGQVFLPEGIEAIGLHINVGTDSANDKYFQSAVTGEATAYGLGGYEIELSDLVSENNQTFWIQVANEEGFKLSEIFLFDSYDKCKKNLILINFITQDTNLVHKSIVTPDPSPTLEAYP